MKKLLYIFLALAVASFTLTACGDDDDNDNGITFTNTPEKDAAGVYQGYFTRQRGGTTTVDTAAGTMEIIPTDSAYFADFHFVSTPFNLDVKSVANISHADRGYVFYNNLPANPVGSAWAGRINNEGTMNLTFQIRQRVGRRTYTFNYTFEGQRTN